MSYATGTPFLNLPQTVGNDHRDWFDTNAAFLDLDTKMKTLWDGASSTADILEQLQETVSGLNTDLAALTTTVNGHTTTLQTVNESLVLINSALTALNTDVRTKFDSAGIADPYDPTYGTYDIDDVVTYNGQRYRCVTAVTAAEPFDADKWLAEDVQTVINQINSILSRSTTKAINFTNGYANIIDSYAYERSGLTIVDKIQVQVNTEIPTSTSQVLVTLDVTPAVEMRCAFITANGVTFLGKLSTTGELILDNYTGNAITVNTKLYVIGNMIID